MTYCIAEDNRITIMGHAGAGTIGNDIVCAALSGLTETMREAFSQLTPMRTIAVVEAGFLRIEFTRPNEDTQLLYDALCLGLEGIAEGNEKYVEWIDNRTTEH